MYRERLPAPQRVAGIASLVCRGLEMAERKRLVAGNWKMNGLRADDLALARHVVARARQPHRCELLVCPAATLLAVVGGARAGSDLALFGQECQAEPKGALTGCTSA